MTSKNRRTKSASEELPPPRPFDWEMKAVSSAKTGFRKHPDGRLELTIEHDTIRGVTPRMLRWWFEHIGGTMEHGGETYPRYLVWHPLDHIRWELSGEAPGGGAGVGARFRIVEAFGRNPEHRVDSVDTVEKLDETGIVLSSYVLGDRIFRLEHRFEPVEDGTRYDSQMIVGSSSPFGRLFFNRLVRPRLFSDEMGPAWLKHNIEEVGNFEHFLPALYARHRSSHAPPSDRRGEVIGETDTAQNTTREDS